MHVLWGKILKLKVDIYTKWDSIVHVDYICIVTSFPGSPHVRTKKSKVKTQGAQ